MQKQMRILLITAGVAALAGCSAETNPLRNIYTEAGSELDGGDFGNSTMTNTQVMINPNSFVIDMTRRFAGDVPNTVNFAFNSAQLDGEAQSALRQQADWIRQFPEIRFRVYGHTDLVGSDRYNRSLGLRRANAVVAYLSTQGISRSRLEAVASFGETQPVVFTQEQERRNRRTVTEVSGMVGKKPAPLNGKYAEVIFQEYVESATEFSSSAIADAQGEGTSQ